jgi:hypothetical protein
MQDTNKAATVDPYARLLADAAMGTPNQYTPLLAEFRACDRYAGRLAFWEKHGLVGHFYYWASDVAPELHAQREDMLKHWFAPIGQTYIPWSEHPDDWLWPEWQSVKTIPILTLALLGEGQDEEKQLSEWGVRVRSGMSEAPPSGDILIKRFKSRYRHLAFSGQHRISDAQRYLDKQKETVATLVDGAIKSRNRGWVQGHVKIEVSGVYFDAFMRDFTEGLDPVTKVSSYHDPLPVSWGDFDTYLYAKSWYEYAVWLEHFDPETLRPQPVSEAPRQAPETPATLAEWFVNPNDVERCVEALRRYESSPIGEGNRWNDKRGNKAVVVAWVDRLEAKNIIKPVGDRSRLIPALQTFFPGLTISRRTLYEQPKAFTTAKLKDYFTTSIPH